MYPYLEFYVLDEEDSWRDENDYVPDLTLKNGDAVSGSDYAGEYFEYVVGVRLNDLGARLLDSVRTLAEIGLLEITEDMNEFISIAPRGGPIGITPLDRRIVSRVGDYDTRMSALLRQRTSRTFVILLATVAFLTLPLPAQTNYFTDWPAGTSPAEVGKRVAEHFVTSPHADPKHIVYQEVCTWYGALTFAQLSGDKDLSAKLIQRFDPLMTPAGADLIGKDRHVDFTVFGTVPLELYLQTKHPKYLDLGKSFPDRQWENPTPNGLTPETRFWIDDMYMITTVEVQAFRATGDPKYLDRAALEMVAYYDKLQQPNGLFYHAPDAPFFWGRGNGWVAAGMTELLRSLPANHPRRARILESYREMMHTLLGYQSSDGMWRQLIDHPEAWPETSSTGMRLHRPERRRNQRLRRHRQEE